MSLRTHSVVRRGNQITRDCPVCSGEMHRIDDAGGHIVGWQCRNDDCAHREDV